MLKISVRRLTTHLGGASALAVLGGGIAACGADASQALASDVQTKQSSSEVESVASAGSARIELGWHWVPPNTIYAAKVLDSSTDEYIRVGESVTFAVPTILIWNNLHQYPMQPDLERMKGLTVTMRVLYWKNGAKVSSVMLNSEACTGDTTSTMRTTTGEFKIPHGVDSMQFEFVLTDPIAPATSVTIPADRTQTIPILGDTKTKTILFDNLAQAARNRVIEPGAAGEPVRIVYTDWRADLIADTSLIDTGIGQATGYSRFGEFAIPLFGKLVHEITYGVAYNDGSGWRAETPLATNKTSRLLPRSRTTYESTLNVPASAKSMSIYFHVKTYLIADYSRAGEVRERKYQQGEKVLVRERWDNPDGANTNYDFPL